MNHQLCLILNFGGQYNQLIARRVRECGVYCEVISRKTPIEEIKKRKPTGIILQAVQTAFTLKTLQELTRKFLN